MEVRNIRQILKACADDTRLRIMNILFHRSLTVTEVYSILGINQPTASKHLSRLRMLRIVLDRREGNMVYYGLNRNPESPQGKIVNFLLGQFNDVRVFQEDEAMLRQIKRNQAAVKSGT